MSKEFFVILNHPNPEVRAVHLEKIDSSNVQFFETKELAEAAAEKTCLGAIFGYEVFCLGRGE